MFDMVMYQYLHRQVKNGSVEATPKGKEVKKRQTKESRQTRAEVISNKARKRLKRQSTKIDENQKSNNKNVKPMQEEYLVAESQDQQE